MLSRPYRTRPACAHTIEDSVYVRADAQRRGIGLSLLRRLVEEAQVRSFRQMIAVIGHSDNHVQGTLGLGATAEPSSPEVVSNAIG